ncbi:hypothetical protein DRQ18_01385 [bacterium]|nr:MAG: hypothetical protein DRQ18_01385 [bacterium]
MFRNMLLSFVFLPLFLLSGIFTMMLFCGCGKEDPVEGLPLGTIKCEVTGAYTEFLECTDGTWGVWTLMGDTAWIKGCERICIKFYGDPYDFTDFPVTVPVIFISYRSTEGDYYIGSSDRVGTLTIQNIGSDHNVYGTFDNCWAEKDGDTVYINNGKFNVRGLFPEGRR